MTGPSAREPQPGEPEYRQRWAGAVSHRKIHGDATFMRMQNAIEAALIEEGHGDLPGFTDVIYVAALGALSPAAGPPAGDTAPDDASRQRLLARNAEAWAEVARLRSEVAALHTWAGLMSLLDEHYPGDVVDGSSGDPGPRIVALLRENAALRDAGNALADGLAAYLGNVTIRPLDGLLSAWREVAGTHPAANPDGPVPCRRDSRVLNCRACRDARDAEEGR